MTDSPAPARPPNRAAFRATRHALAAVFALLAFACTEKPLGVGLPNQAPRIRITSGPVEDSLHSYRVTFHWTAHDPDGAVAGFEYALDDTTAPDSLRSTALNSVSLVFRIREPPPAAVRPGPSSAAAPDSLSAYHTFHVRARDNQGLRSAFASASLNAFTITPTTSIVSPDPRYEARVGTTFEVAWTGHDLDGTRPPSRFSTRLVSVPPDSAGMVDVERLERPDGGDPWTPFGEQTSARFSVLTGTYLFGVRALDEAGAIESLLRLGENVIRLDVIVNPGFPLLIVTAGRKSVRLPEANEAEKTFPMVSGQSTSFSWTVSAAHYGARIVAQAYGVDLVGLDPYDPGWRSVSGPPLSLRFDNPPGVEDSVHALYFRITDSIGRDMIADVLLAVGPPDFSRDILYVDDIGRDSQGTPSDTEHDRWIRDVLLAEAGRRSMRVDDYEVWQPNGFILPRAPDLAILRRYRLLVWAVKMSGSVLQGSMDPHEGTQAVAEYVAAGGNLWIFGTSALVQMALPVIPMPFPFLPGELGYDVLHVESVLDGSQIIAGGFLRGQTSRRRLDGLIGAVPTAAAAAAGWPELITARAPYTDGSEGIPLCEGMTIGYEHGNRPGDLDTLYTYVSNSRRQPPPASSPLDGTPCALSYTGLRGNKVLVTAFPTYWWSEGATDSLGAKVVRLVFGEEAMP